jgi:TPR repeat protein
MRKLAPVVVPIAVFLLIGISGCTKTIEEGRDAYKKGDYKEASRIFKPLAERGDVGAQFTLGEMHSRGQGVPKDEADATKWYRMAADQGHAEAQNKLGISYTFGKGVPKDFVLAYMWYDIAASNYTDAKEREGAARNRDAIGSLMKPAEVERAQTLAREWKPKKGK